MAKNGIAHPEVIDFVTTKDGRCYLYIVQVDKLSDEDLFALQNKINNYLAYALDGQLAEMYPQYASAQVTIQLQLGSDPSKVQQQFFAAVKDLCEREGVQFEVEIPEHLRELEHQFPTERARSKPWWRLW
jgi:hypothetical protein